MLGKVMAFVGQVVVMLLAGVGLATVWVIWEMAHPVEKKTVSVPVVVAAPVPAVAQRAEGESVAGVDDCLCGKGPLCTGPRGGRYCMDDSGVKRYR